MITTARPDTRIHHPDRSPRRRAKAALGFAVGLVLACVGCSGSGGGEGVGDTTKNSGGNDNTPPVISDIRVTADRSSALILWTTDEPSTSSVSYGKTAALEGGTVSDVNMVTEHQIRLTGLDPSSAYQFSVTSVDENENEATTGGQNFNTSATSDVTPPVLSGIEVYLGRDWASVAFVTDEPASSRVDYGLSSNYTDNETRSAFSTTHMVTLRGLQANTTYHFMITVADSNGNLASSTDRTFKTTNTIDTSPPKITEVKAAPKSDSATITWTTDEISNSRVDYGTSKKYGTLKRSSVYTLSHTIELTGLAPDTTYNFKVTSADRQNNWISSPNATFKTLPGGGGGGPGPGPLAISNVDVVLSSTSATVTWQTNVAASSRVDYGLTNAYTLGNESSSARVQNHQITLSGLTPTTVYHYKVTSVDATNKSVSTGDLTFRTTEVSSSGSKREIKQWGITWRFKTEVTSGQYANGDWWVLGPVDIVNISPKAVNNKTSWSGKTIGYQHGSMINPSGRGSSQGWGTFNTIPYDGKLNVGMGVSASNPLRVPSGSSLVSTVFPSVPYSSARRPAAKEAAVLTVVAQQPPPNAFRPPYCGKDKKSYFTEADLDYSKLGKYKLVGNPSSFAAMESKTSRPYLSNSAGYSLQDIQPKGSGIRGYGRETASHLGGCGLLLNSDASNGVKRKLLIQLTQIGIDFYGIAKDGGAGNWFGNGGIASGRIFPIIFAGTVLNDSGMKNIRKMTPTARFQEIDQTFIIQQSDVGRKLGTGTYRKGVATITFKQSDVGKAEWGTWHRLRPERDNANWIQPYRQCCNANAWWAQALASYMMGMEDLWDHPPFFKYLDRYRQVQGARNDDGWLLSWVGWHVQNWDKFRNQF